MSEYRDYMRAVADGNYVRSHVLLRLLLSALELRQVMDEAVEAGLPVAVVMGAVEETLCGDEEA